MIEVVTKVLGKLFSTPSVRDVVAKGVTRMYVCPTREAITKGEVIAASAAATATGIVGYMYIQERLKELKEMEKTHFERGARQGSIETKKELRKYIAVKNARLYACFAMMVYITGLYCEETDKERNKKLADGLFCLGTYAIPGGENEFKKIYLGQYDFKQIKEIYLNALSKKELDYIDQFIKVMFIEDEDSPMVAHMFYTTEWKFYLDNKM